MKIDKNVPVPRCIGQRGTGVYPWDEMSVGDSFFVPESFRRKVLVAASASARGKKYGERYGTRAENGGVRVWRVE